MSFLTGSCVILHKALINAQWEPCSIVQSFMVLKQRACTVDTQQHYIYFFFFIFCFKEAKSVGFGGGGCWICCCF